MSEQALQIGLLADKNVCPTKPTAKTFVSYAKLIGIITFFSRILGMARESIAANYFGGGMVYSAFQVAFTIPNLFRKLLGEGALSAAFIPLYAQAVKRDESKTGMEEKTEEKTGTGAVFSPSGEPASDFGEHGRTAGGEQTQTPVGELSAPQFAAASVNLLCSILLALTIVGEALLWLGVHFIPMEIDRLLACKLTMIMLPYVLLVCGTAFLGSILQVHHRFAAITFTAVISNVCLIIAMIAAARMVDLHSEAGQIQAVRWLSFSVLIAGAFQILMLLPSLRAVGFRFHPSFHFWTPQVRRMVTLTIPVALSAAVLQISVLMDKGFAFLLSQGPGRSVFHLFGHTLTYPMAEGATQRLNWAQFMYQFPLGVFAIALATAIFPKLSADAQDAGATVPVEQSTAHLRQPYTTSPRVPDNFKTILRQGVEACLFIGLPASVGMIVVRYPAVQLVFQHGNFTANDTRLVALSTAIYSAAIWAFSLQQILNRAYYALHDTTTPLIWGIVNLSINTIVEIPLLWTGLHEAGMAVGTLVSFALQAIVMLWMLDRRCGGLHLRQSAAPITKMILASLLMLLACLAVQYLPFFPHGSHKLAWASQLFVLMTVGGFAYFGACAAMGMNVLEHFPRRKKRLAS
jgi:putative peptidoglycan lipid II flippase